MTNQEIAIAVACKLCHARKKAVTGTERTLPVTEARMLVILLLKREGFKDQTIGWVLERDRSTIANIRRRAEALLIDSEVFRGKFNKAMGEYEQQKSLRES